MLLLMMCADCQFMFHWLMTVATHYELLRFYDTFKVVLHHQITNIFCIALFFYTETHVHDTTIMGMMTKVKLAIVVFFYRNISLT